MFYKLTKDGKRMAIPKQNKPKVDSAEVEKAGAKKKGKK
jgi:hypothetical protein